MAEVARRGSLQRHRRACPTAARAVFKTAHEIDCELARAPPGRLPEAHGQRRVEDDQPARTSADRRRRRRAPICSPGSEGCLGITVFRDGCKGGQVLNVGVRRERRARRRRRRRARWSSRGPHSLSGATYRMETPIGTAFVTVNDTPGGEPFEVFVQVGKAGSDTMAVAEALGRLVSLVLRLPSPLSAAAPARGGRSASSRGSAAASRPASAPPRSCRCRTRSRERSASTSGSGAATSRRRRRRRRRQRGAAWAISARSAGRPRSCTRKAARSASPAASTSAEEGEPMFSRR